MLKSLKSPLILIAVFLISAVSQANTPTALFNFKIFYVPGKGPMVETYLDVDGSSISYRNLGDTAQQGRVQSTIVIRRGDEVIDFDKSAYDSPISYGKVHNDFLHVHRFQLKPGSYMLDVQLRDLVDTSATPATISQVLTVPQVSDSPFISGIELISAYKEETTPSEYSKSGVDMLPLVSEFYDDGMNHLAFYTELYNSQKSLGDSSKFVLVAYLQDDLTHDEIPGYHTVSVKETQPVVPWFTGWDISKLKSGDYQLVLEMRNDQNNLVCRKKLKFKRYKRPIENTASYHVSPDSPDFDVTQTFAGKIDNKDSLYFFVNSLTPIAKQNERMVINYTFPSEKKSDAQAMQRFLYTFWTDRAPQNPDSAWQAYKKQVYYVENAFSAQNKHGFSTDRGRVFLKYGAPNDIANQPAEPTSYPYQIWRYYKAGGSQNVRFVFYNRDLTMQDYELIDCNSIPGEIRNPRWQMLLEQRTDPLNNVDQTTPTNRVGGQAGELYNNPH